MITRERVSRAFEEYSRPNHPHDCKKIIEAVKEKCGVDITLAEANMFWVWHSEIWSAGFLSLPESDEIAAAFERFLNSFSP